MSNNSNFFSKFTKSAPKGVTNSSLFGLNQIKMLLPLNLPRVNVTYFFAVLLLIITNLYLFYKLNTITLEFLSLENRINLLNQNIESLISDNLKLNNEIKRLILEKDKTVNQELLNFKKNILIHNHQNAVTNYKNILFWVVCCGLIIGTTYCSYNIVQVINTSETDLVSRLCDTFDFVIMKLSNKLGLDYTILYKIKDDVGRDFIVEIYSRNDVGIFVVLSDNSKVDISTYLNELVTQSVVDNTLSTTTGIVTNVISNVI